MTDTDDRDDAEQRIAAYWPQDREQRAALWNSLMAAGVARFWQQHAADVAAMQARGVR